MNGLPVKGEYGRFIIWLFGIFIVLGFLRGFRRSFFFDFVTNKKNPVFF
jgi:hypothetical protein